MRIWAIINQTARRRVMPKQATLYTPVFKAARSVIPPGKNKSNWLRIAPKCIYLMKNPFKRSAIAVLA